MPSLPVKLKILLMLAKILEKQKLNFSRMRYFTRKLELVSNILWLVVDFNESSAKVYDVMTQKLKYILYENKKFLKLMDDQAVKVGNHCRTPFPLRNSVMKLSNNRKMVERRAQYLKKRLEKDSKFFCHYKEFMEEILSKEHAKIFKSTWTNGRVWYLPHHGVYHPAKPNKIRFIFYCSAEYVGRSIKQYLMAGHDLTNQIAGTLLRFWQERIPGFCK